ncbi:MULTISPECIES: acetylglutamate kinase [unclassified Paraflavitalea]|uniref:acetylglutamate kinase n=1 Tax=unclassified Paraflavitalea TaxID=2798305 RepID=UPI003D34A44A
MEPLYVIKIGGNILDATEPLQAFLKSFASVPGKKILIHGGGKIATRIGDQLGIESKYVDGRRITDAATIDLVTMVYGGLVNKQVVAQLQALGTNAIGITGADANLIPAKKRPVKEIDYGFVGDVKSAAIPPASWQVLINNGWVPVVAPLTHDQEGHILNTNADTMAQEIAKALAPYYKVQLIYSFEKAGVLLDANDDSTVIPEIKPDHYETLKASGKIFAGMIPKLDNAFAAVRDGVNKVIIGNAAQLELLIAGKTGTSIVHE